MNDPLDLDGERRVRSARPVAGPRISDHALLRMLERSGLDVEAVRAAVSLSLAAAHQALVTMGGGDCLIVLDGLTYVVRGGTVTTTLHAGSPQSKAMILKQRAER